MSDHAELIRRIATDLDEAAAPFYQRRDAALAFSLLAAVDRAAADLRQVASQLAAPSREPQTWQPIESAPKDLTWVLLLSPDEYANGNLDVDGDVWISRWVNGRWYRQRGREAPTHWQPLPSAPSPSPTPEPQG